jgi:hypothetical protein
MEVKVLAIEALEASLSGQEVGELVGEISGKSRPTGSARTRRCTAS